MTFVNKRIPLIVALAILMIPSSWVRANAPDCYIVAAGVDNYLQEPKLSGDDNDARNASQAFLAQQGKLFGKVYVQTLLDGQATHANIYKQMQDYAQLGKAGDFFVFFLSGHGGLYNNTQTWFFCPYDESPDNNDADLPEAQLISCADALVKQGKKVVIIVDACNSGRLITAAQPYFDRYKDAVDGGLIVAVSSTAQQESNALGPYSAFAKAFVDGMAGAADANKDGKVTLLELRSYTPNRTYELLRQVKNKAKQDCNIAWSANISGDMPLALLKPMPTPAEAVSKATVWSGNETLAGHGKVTFNTYPGGHAVMIDLKGTASDGIWLQRGKEYILRFPAMKAAYTGTLNETTIVGTAAAGKSSWSFSVKKLSSPNGK